MRTLLLLWLALTDCTCKPGEYVECHMERLGGHGDCFTCWSLHLTTEEGK